MDDRQTTPTQFSLRSILVLTTVIAAMFAALGAMRIPPQHIAIGVGAIVATVVATIAVIECIAQCLGRR